MKAWTITQLGTPLEALSLTDKQLPAPGPAELLIQVTAAAIGLPDVMMCTGDYEFKPELPFTPGQEICGIVQAIGENVSLKVGDRVMGVSSFFNGQGGFAQQCMSMDGMVFKAPDAMPDIEAAAFTIAFQTAWIALVERGKLQAGDTLLVHGAAGGCGAAAVKLAHSLGAHVIGVVSSEKKAAMVKNWGASEVINRSKDDFVSEINRLTDGRGANVIFDPVGGETFKRSVACLANEGRLLAVGFASGEWGQADTHELVLKNATCLGVYVGAYSAEQRLHFHNQLVELYLAEKINLTGNTVVEFSDVAQALTDVASGNIAGKMVVKVTNVQADHV